MNLFKNTKATPIGVAFEIKYFYSNDLPHRQLMEQFEE